MDEVSTRLPVPAATVIAVRDGAAGLEAVETYLPDILLTDIHMPEMDGIELIRRIRNTDSSKCPFLPIVAVTAFSDMSHVFAARDAGATEVLCKPVSAEALHKRIRSIAAQPRQFIRTKTYFGPDRRRFVATGFNGEERRSEANDKCVLDELEWTDNQNHGNEPA